VAIRALTTGLSDFMAVAVSIGESRTSLAEGKWDRKP
jgi:hypothetical protein